MRDLQMLFDRAISELDVIDIPYGNIVEIKPNTRAKSRWGQCSRRGNDFYININVDLLQDTIPMEKALDTIIHEILHTCPNCMNHGHEWQKWAELVNDCYACYNIKRCTSANEKGINESYNIRNYKWIIRCGNCDRQWKYQRKPTRFDIGYNGYLIDCECPCGCENELRLIKL